MVRVLCVFTVFYRRLSICPTKSCSLSITSSLNRITHILHQDPHLLLDANMCYCTYYIHNLHIYIYISLLLLFVLFFTTDCYRDLSLALLLSSCLASTVVSCGSLDDLSLSSFAARAQIQKNAMLPYCSSQNVSKCSLSSYKTTSGTVDGSAQSKDIIKWIFHS